MTDFTGRVLRPEKNDFAIRSPMDNDFYKETMGFFIHTFYPDVDVRFRFINRHPHIPVADIVDEGELRQHLDHARALRYSSLTDIAYLRGQNVYHDRMFDTKYLAFKEQHTLPPYELHRVGDQYDFSTEDKWPRVTPWETQFLAITSELFYRSLMREMTEKELDIFYARAKDKLYRKLLRIKKEPSIRIADFGFRRRHSHLWHQYVIEMCVEVLGEQFTGASSTWMAFNKGLVPIGTNAHELPMVLTALADTDEGKLDAQYEVLRKWGKLFPKGALRIILPDTYGSRQFWKNMPADLADEVAQEWRGVRLDSGDPLDEAEQLLRWYQKMGVSPWDEGKVVIPSDGLDVDSILKIHANLEGKIRHPFGWGTMLTNDFVGCHPRGEEKVTMRGKELPLTWNEAFKGHSFVCKVDRANGRPVVKLSNNILKATGPKEEVERYLRIFRPEGRIYQDVLV